MMDDRARFSALAGWFARVTAAAPGERAALVAQLAAADQELGAELERMLAADAGTVDWRQPVVAAGIEALGEAATEALPEIPGYRLIRRLSDGGMGIVFAAEQEDPRRQVAIKLLRPGPHAAELRERFTAEARILARLDHPHIARIFAAGSISDGPYFVMEFIDGRPLDQHARAAGLSVRARVLLLAKVCDAVHHAHQRGIVHRDLKPANLLVGADGEPRVVDFGIARATDADLRPETLRTLHDQLLGTLAYMSPEQLSLDPGRIDLRTDLYSLGVVAYELLTGHLPFDPSGKGVATMVQLVTSGTPVPLGQHSVELRGDLECIVTKAMAQEPDRRYSSAALLAADLQHFLRHEPISARPPSTAYALAKFARRQPALALALACLLIVILGSLGVTLHLLDAARAANAAEKLETRHAIESSRVALAVERVLTSLLNAPNLNHGGDPDVRLSDLLDTLTTRLENWRGPPQAELRLRRVLGETYLSLRKAETGLAHANRGLQLVRELQLAETVDGMRLRALRVGLLLVAGDLQTARSESEALLPEVTARCLPRLPVLWEARLQHSQMLVRCGEPATAEKLLRAWREESQQIGEQETGRAVEIRRQLAQLLGQRGDHEGAQAMLAEAKRVAPGLAASQSAAYYNLALLEERLAEAAASQPGPPPDQPPAGPAKAQKEQVRALVAAFSRREFERVLLEAAPLRATLLEAFGPDDPTVVDVGGMVGLAHFRMAHFKDAREVLIALLPHADRAGVKERVMYRRALGICLLNLGEPAAAEPHLRQAIAEMLESGPDFPSQRGEAMTSLGRCLMLRGELAEAEKTFRAAIQVLTENGVQAPKATAWLREVESARARGR